MTSVVCAGNGALSDGRYRGLAHESDLVLVKVGTVARIRHDDIRAGVQWVIAHQKRFNVFVGMRIDHRRQTGELTYLGQELPARVTRDRDDVAKAVALANRHRSLQNDQHSGAGFSGGQKPFTTPVAPHAAEPADASNFRLGQFRKQLVAPALKIRRNGAGHGGHGRLGLGGRRSASERQ